MQELRAYLLIRLEENNWDVSVHRDFETITNKWQSLSETKNKTAILHVGFWRPNTDDFEVIASRFPNRVLVTASSRFALPPPCHIAPDEIDKILGVPIYLVLSGWGYETSNKEINLQRKFPQNATNEQNNEEISEYDFYEICGEKPSEKNILRYLKFTPSWFLKLPIKELILSVRSQKFIKKESINIIADLIKFGDRGLYGNKNLGSKSIFEIPKELFRVFQNYQKSVVRICLEKNKDEDEKSFNTFLDSLNFVLSQLSSTQNKVLIMRMGFLSSRSMTLREIGKELNYSCERIRQIENKCIKKIEQTLIWKKTLLTHLETLFVERNEPLFFAGLEILDPWFQGISRHEEVFEYILDNFCKNQFSFIRQDNQMFISRIDQKQWEKYIEIGKNILESEIEKNISEEDAKALIFSLLIINGVELRSELWRVITRGAHFAETQDGKKTLLSFGLGAENKVEAILMGSETPLHYSEIAKKVENKYHQPLDIRRIHLAAKNVGMLFGRGTYGLVKHFPLSDTECNLLLKEIEDFIDESDNKKQWHCSEICEAMQERGLDFNIHFSQYIINIVLSRSKSFTNLNRMIWTKRSDAVRINAEKRIEINQAIIMFIKNAGKPLTGNDIREKLISSRGLGGFYQIQPEGSLIRVGRNLWGIKERDLPFSENELTMLFEKTKKELEIRQKGLHISEIKNILLDSQSLEKLINNQSLILFLIQKSSIMKVDQGQYIYLADWIDSRRFSMREAALKIFNSSPLDGYTLDELHQKIEKLIERTIEKSKVSGTISNIEAIYNEKSKRWTLPNEDEEADIDIT